jgi:hypothetical protein
LQVKDGGRLAAPTGIDSLAATRMEGATFGLVEEIFALENNLTLEDMRTSRQQFEDGGHGNRFARA